MMEIPLVAHLGIKEKDKNILKLERHTDVKNHLGTIHAAAQFALAESQSGYYLESIFPQYKGQVIPLLRSSSVKYKNPASSDIYAVASIKDEALKKFELQFEKKGRSSVMVDVKVLDVDGVVTMQGEFGWFIQKM